MAIPLHVVHVVLSLDYGGLERVVLHLTRSAARLGQQISILCLERFGALREEAEKLGATVYCINKQPGLRLATIKQVKQLLAKLKPDVVHTHQIGALFYTGPAARSLNVPVIVHTEHGKQIRTMKQKLLGWWAARYAHRLYAVSADIHQSLAKSIASSCKIEVVANGIDVAALQQPRDTATLRQQWNLPPDVPVIGTVGRLARVKRQDLLLDTFRLVLAKIPDCHLMLVGDGDERTKLEAMAEVKGLARNVRFAGMQAEPSGFLQLMSAFILTSESEGLPLSLLEAWAVGVPCLVFDVGGLSEVVKESQTGYLIPFGDTTLLAEKVIYVLQHPEAVQPIVSRCQAEVKRHYDVDSMANNYDHRYRKLLAGRKP